MVPAASLRFARREVGLRSNPVADASTIGFSGPGSIAHALTWLASAARITRTEVVAEDSLRPTSGFAICRRAQKSAGARHHPPLRHVVSGTWHVVSGFSRTGSRRRPSG